MKLLVVFLLVMLRCQSPEAPAQKDQDGLSAQFIENIKELHTVKDKYQYSDKPMRKIELEQMYQMLINCKNQNCEKQRRQFYREVAHVMYKKQGIIGEQGPQGLKGVDGEEGFKGQKGPRGDQGEQGDPGENAKIDLNKINQYKLLLQGPPGEKGDTGDMGDVGPEGEMGEQGEVGPPGKRGRDGKNGENGKEGPEGPEGDQGEQGDRGDVGDRGEQGDQGPKGEQGDQGPQGQQGPFGDKGAKGEKGETGPNGLSITRQMVEGISRSVVWSIFGKIQSIHNAQRPIPLFDSYRILQLDDRCLAEYGAFGVACEMSQSKCTTCECANAIESLKCCLRTNKPLFYNTTSNMTEEVQEKISIWDVMELDKQEKQIKKILVIKTDECIFNGINKTYVCDKDKMINVRKNVGGLDRVGDLARFKQKAGFSQDQLDDLANKYQFSHFVHSGQPLQIADLPSLIAQTNEIDSGIIPRKDTPTPGEHHDSVFRQRFRKAIQQSFQSQRR